jgi:hypothetical protein
MGAAWRPASRHAPTLTRAARPRPSPRPPPAAKTCPPAPSISCRQPLCNAAGDTVPLNGTCTASDPTVELTYLVDGTPSLTATCPEPGKTSYVTVKPTLTGPLKDCPYGAGSAYNLTSEPPPPLPPLCALPAQPLRTPRGCPPWPTAAGCTSLTTPRPPSPPPGLCPSTAAVTPTCDPVECMQFDQLIPLNGVCSTTVVGTTVTYCECPPAAAPAAGRAGRGGGRRCARRGFAPCRARGSRR